MMKQKMLLPLLMLLKIKLKAIIPIMLALVHFKATKALLLSKIAIVLVAGFLAFQLFMKKTAMNMMVTAMEPAPVTAMPYGPPSPLPTSSYGAPSTVSSYEPPVYEAPSWEPAAASGGPYARVGWDAQTLAYNGYHNQQTSNQQTTNKI